MISHQSQFKTLLKQLFEVPYKITLEILEQKLESDPLNKAAILNNLALIYQYQGAYNEAEPFYVQAIEILRQWVGDDYLDIPIDLSKLQNELQRSHIEFPPYNPQVMSVSLNVKGTSINSHLIENSYGRAALSAFVRLQ